MVQCLLLLVDELLTLECEIWWWITLLGNVQ